MWIFVMRWLKVLAQFLEVSCVLGLARVSRYRCEEVGIMLKMVPQRAHASFQTTFGEPAWGHAAATTMEGQPRRR